MSTKTYYGVSFQSQSIAYPGADIECIGANVVRVYLTAAHVAAGVTINGHPGYAGVNEFASPSPEGRISSTIRVGVPSTMVPKVVVQKTYVVIT